MNASGSWKRTTLQRRKMGRSLPRLTGGMRVQQSKVQRCIKDVQCGRVRDREIEVECEVIMCVSFQFVRLGERLRYVSKR